MLVAFALTSERPVTLMATGAIIWQNCLQIFINATHKYHFRPFYFLFTFILKNTSAYICWLSYGKKSQYEITGISFCGHIFCFSNIYLCWLHVGTNRKKDLCVLQSSISTQKKNLVRIQNVLTTTVRPPCRLTPTPRPHPRSGATPRRRRPAILHPSSCAANHLPQPQHHRTTSLLPLLHKSPFFRWWEKKTSRPWPPRGYSSVITSNCSTSICKHTHNVYKRK